VTESETETAAAPTGHPPPPPPRLSRATLLHHGLVVLLIGVAALTCGFSLFAGLSSRFVLEQRLGGAVPFLLLLVAGGAVLAARLYFVLLHQWMANGWPRRATFAFRWLLYCLVGGSAGYLAFCQPFDAATFHLGLGLVATGYVAGLAAAARASRFVRGRFWRGLEVVLFNLCLVAVGAEAGLRIFAEIRPSVLFLQPDADASTSIERMRSKPGQDHLGFPFNSQGYYDTEFVPKRPGRHLVVAIGDSFSYGVVPLPFHFTSVAERRLPATDVYNLGVPSIGPREYLVLLTSEALRLQPEVVVVDLFIGNDFTETALPEEPGGAVRRWLDRRNLLLLQVPRRLSIPEEDRRRASGEGGARRRAGAPEGQRSAAGPPTLEALRARYPWLADPRLEEPSMRRRRYVEVERLRLRDLMNLSVQEFERRCRVLQRMRDLAAPVPVLFLLIPDEFQVEDGVWDVVSRRAKASPEDRDRPQRILTAWLDSRGLPYLDLLPVFRSVPPLEDGRRHLYHHWNTHFNARGNREAGRALAAALRPYLLPSGETG
jgi:hypothetical protein